MLKKVLFVDRDRNISFKEVNEVGDFPKLLNGKIETRCIKPIARSICIAAGNGAELYDSFKSLSESLNREDFIVYIAANDGKGIENAPILDINENEVEYFHKFKETVLNKIKPRIPLPNL